MPTLVAVTNAYASLNSQSVDLHVFAAISIVIVFSLVIFVNLLKDNV